MVPFDF
jgi:uncharacterized protein (DUF1330 family)